MNGVCPSCHAAGAVGTPCAHRICQRRKTHFVDTQALEGVRTPDELIGVRFGNYLLTRLLGSGGFGRVYDALRLPLDMHVAVKVLNEIADTSVDAERRRLFALEAKAMAKLTHPNIVRLLDFGSYEGTPYLVTEFVAGQRTLKSEVRARATSHRTFSAPEIRSLLTQIAGALEAAHEQSIVHRDIKPDNIMLQAVPGQPDFVRVLDFGLAKFVDERSHTQNLLGTPRYMAPEQIDGKNLGPWTDLYALGVIAIELITGVRPFSGDTAATLRAKRDPRHDVLEMFAGHDVPRVARDFFRKALAHDPAQRFRSATDFRSALEAMLDATQTTSTPPPIEPPPSPRATIPPLPRAPITIQAPPLGSETTAQASPIAPTVAIAPIEVQRARAPRRATAAGLAPATPAADMSLPGGKLDALGAPGSFDTQDRGHVPSRRHVIAKGVIGGAACVALGVGVAIGLSGDPATPAPAARPAPPAVIAERPSAIAAPIAASTEPPPRATNPASAPNAEPQSGFAIAVPPGFVRIAAGRFVMGSPAAEPGRQPDELERTIAITRSFLMKTTEVTQAEWRARMGNNPSTYTSCGDDCPVESVTWYDAIAFANRSSFDAGLPYCYELTRCVGESPGLRDCKVRFHGTSCLGYRLPTEAEFEYAARAGAATATPAGDVPVLGQHRAPELGRSAWYGGNSRVTYRGAFDCKSWPQKEITAASCGPHPVATKTANAWGLHDVLGNVAEWVHDGHAPYPTTGKLDDPVGPDSAGERVTRGGDWTTEPRAVRHAARDRHPPGFKDGTLGFRIARTLP